MFPKHAVTRTSLALPYIKPLCHLEMLGTSRTGITQWDTWNLKAIRRDEAPEKQIWKSVGQEIEEAAIIMGSNYQ